MKIQNQTLQEFINKFIVKLENLEMPEDWDKFMKEHNMSGLIKI